MDRPGNMESVEDQTQLADIETEWIDTWAMESFEDRPLYMSQATKSSLEATVRVMTDFGGASASQCTICMEKIPQGTEANKMP
ncbi:hypothetical protein BT93_E0293 [Corymbia citriodora subsp. variegata]|nr:hypothetical protein BT93_E0293 [Corymbia citriodora subsp. variegata]